MAERRGPELLWRGRMEWCSAPIAHSTQQFFHSDDERGRLDSQSAGELHERGDGGLANAALHLAHERAIDVGSQSEVLLRELPRNALLTQHLPEYCRDLFYPHVAAGFARACGESFTSLWLLVHGLYPTDPPAGRLRRAGNGKESMT